MTQASHLTNANLTNFSVVSQFHSSCDSCGNCADFLLKLLWRITYNCAANFFCLSDEVSSNTSEVPDDFDYVVTAEQWSGVLEAVKNQDQDQLKSLLQKVDDDVQKQKLVNFS